MELFCHVTFINVISLFRLSFVCPLFNKVFGVDHQFYREWKEVLYFHLKRKKSIIFFSVETYFLTFPFALSEGHLSFSAKLERHSRRQQSLLSLAPLVLLPPILSPLTRAAAATEKQVKEVSCRKKPCCSFLFHCPNNTNIILILSFFAPQRVSYCSEHEKLNPEGMFCPESSPLWPFPNGPKNLVPKMICSTPEMSSWASFHDVNDKGPSL